MFMHVARRALQSTRNKLQFSSQASADAPFYLTYMPVGPLQMNQFVLACPKSKEAAFVDCGGAGAELERLTSWLTDRELTLRHLIQTHSHIDHVLGLSETREKAAPDAPIYLHPKDAPVYENAQESGRRFGIELVDPLPTENIISVGDGEVVKVGNLELKVIFTPGHAPGHVCYWCEEHNILFGGDLLFQGGIGRTDLPLSDPKEMEVSLKRIMELPDETAVLPGHGALTSIGQERMRNPFLR